jgi:hypothetical protein
LTDEAVAAPRQSLDEARLLGIVPQRLAQFLDGRVDAVVEIDKGASRPKPALQFFSCY